MMLAAWELMMKVPPVMSVQSLPTAVPVSVPLPVKPTPLTLKSNEPALAAGETARAAAIAKLTKRILFIVSSKCLSRCYIPEMWEMHGPPGAHAGKRLTLCASSNERDSRLESPHTWCDC